MRDDQATSHSVSKRVRRVQEDIMGNEALGGSLDESAASELLTLGLKGAEGIASSTDGLNDEAAELSMADRLKALRKMMRHLGRLLGEWRELDTEGQLWFWNSVQKQARLLYGEGVQLPTLDELMGSLSQGESPGKIIANIREMLDTQKES